MDVKAFHTLLADSDMFVFACQRTECRAFAVDQLADEASSVVAISAGLLETSLS